MTIQTNAPVVLYSVLTPQALSVADSGKTILVPALANAVGLTLPTPVGNAGITYKIITQARLGFALTITTPLAGTISGTLINNNAGVAECVVKNGGANIVIGDVAATQGTCLDLVSDGAIWLCRGVGNGAAAVFA